MPFQTIALAKRNDPIRALQKLIELGRFDDALRKSEEALSKDPRNSALLVIKSFSQLVFGKNAEAERTAQSALDINPSHAWAWCLYGAAHGNNFLPLIPIGLRNRRRDRRALKAFAQAISLQPECSGIWGMWAAFHEGRMQYDEAEHCYGKAIRFDPDNPAYHAALAGVLINQSKYDQARQFCRTALTLSPDHAKAHELLGTLEYVDSRHDGAMRCFRESLRLDPTSQGAISQLEQVRSYLDFSRAWQEWYANPWNPICFYGAALILVVILSRLSN